MYPQARTVAYGAAAAIALVQIPRGAHYPTDVAAGALVGVAAEAAVNGLAAYIEAATGRDEDRS
jgi:membrane-associated phospholipid phosphatase